MTQLLPLRGKAEFDRVLRHTALRQNCGWLTLLASPNSLQVARLGVIMARRRTRSAVLRNALKRQVRAWLRSQGTGYDCIVLARTKAPFDTSLSRAENCHHMCIQLRRQLGDFAARLEQARVS